MEEGAVELERKHSTHRLLDLCRIILTKLDGTAKGGFIVSLSYELEVPVVYVGTGEKIDDIEDFNAEDFIEGMIKKAGKEFNSKTISSLTIMPKPDKSRESRKSK